MMALTFTDKEFRDCLRRYFEMVLRRRTFADDYFDLFPDDKPADPPKRQKRAERENKQRNSAKDGSTA